MAALAKASKGSIMRVLARVTRLTFHRNFQARRVHGLVTAIAGEVFVTPNQRKPRLPRVIELPMAPAGSVVTCLARRRHAETSFMLAILVTARAGRGKFQGRRIGLLMTAFATELGVSTRQRIMRLLRVIEFRIAPILGVMTCAATRRAAEPPFVVNVVMALLAALWRLFVSGRSVAIHARNGDMLAEKREGRLRMVKAGPSPVAFAVTTLATLT